MGVKAGKSRHPSGDGNEPVTVAASGCLDYDFNAPGATRLLENKASRYSNESNWHNLHRKNRYLNLVILSVHLLVSYPKQVVKLSWNLHGHKHSRQDCRIVFLSVDQRSCLWLHVFPEAINNCPNCLEKSVPLSNVSDANLTTVLPFRTT